MTSSMLRAKGSCCKSSCLHCPYGFTLRKPGLKVLKKTDEFEDDVKNLFEEREKLKSDIASSLLSGAFGKQTHYELEDFSILTLKNYFCGIAVIRGTRVLKLHLKEEFSDQGITTSYIEGLLV